LAQEIFLTSLSEVKACTPRVRTTEWCLKTQTNNPPQHPLA
jgi:hypothetical protein